MAILVGAVGALSALYDHSVDTPQQRDLISLRIIAKIPPRPRPVSDPRGTGQPGAAVDAGRLVVSLLPRRTFCLSTHRPLVLGEFPPHAVCQTKRPLAQVTTPDGAMFTRLIERYESAHLSHYF